MLLIIVSLHFIIKNKNMKKIIISIVIILFIQNSYSQDKSTAQTSKMTVGGGLAYGDSINSVGLNVTGQYFITEQIAIAPAFTYYFPTSVHSAYVGYDNYNRSWMEINVDGNYYPDLDLVKGKLHTYGIAGFNYAIIGYPYYSYTHDRYYTEKEGKIGLNVGAGASFDIGKNFTPFAQIKYTVINSYNQAQLLIGARIEL